MTEIAPYMGTYFWVTIWYKYHGLCSVHFRPDVLSMSCIVLGCGWAWFKSSTLFNNMLYYCNTMVFIWDGNSEIGAHFRSILCYLICLRHLIWSRAVTNRGFFSPKSPIFLHAWATCSNLPSNTSVMCNTNRVLHLFFIFLIEKRSKDCWKLQFSNREMICSYFMIANSCPTHFFSRKIKIVISRTIVMKVMIS